MRLALNAPWFQSVSIEIDVEAVKLDSVKAA